MTRRLPVVPLSVRSILLLQPVEAGQGEAPRGHSARLPFSFVHFFSAGFNLT